jgi:hypothetical protein
VAFLGGVMGKRKEEYTAYLNSAVWKLLRRQALDHADDRCQTCNCNKSLQVHHRVYPKVLGTEKLNDLTVLCNKCHYLFHNHAPLKNKQSVKKKKKLSKKQRKKQPVIKKELLPIERSKKEERKFILRKQAREADLTEKV